MKVQNNFCAMVTFKCNWNCEYCSAKYYKVQKYKMKSDDKVLDNILNLINNSDINVIGITGGEPGLMSSYFFDNLFHNLKKNLKIILHTNGTFLKKGYYEKYKDKIYLLMYHCVENLTDDLKFPEYCYDDKVIPCIVVYKKNIHQIKDFLFKYKDIKFNLQLSIDRLEPENNKIDLNIEDLKILVKELRKIKNSNYKIDMPRLVKMISKNEVKNFDNVQMLNGSKDLIDYELED